MSNFNHNNREWNVTEIDAAGANLVADLKARGFDGNFYHAKSLPVGRQRKAMFGSFLRSAKTGEFVQVV